MYVEAVCPVCLTSHIVPADQRGRRYRCGQCEEVFVINEKSKTTNKRPPRARAVRPADEPDAAVKARPATVVLPDADDAQTGKATGDENGATNGSVRRDPPVARSAPPAERRASPEADGVDRPRKRPLRRLGNGRRPA